TEPPSNCINCLIVVDVPGVVNLNTNLNLSNNSKLVIGGTNTTVLSINNSGSTDFANAYNIILANDGTNSTMLLSNPNAILNANNAGDYDGVLTSFVTSGVTTYFKQMGNAPSGFIGNTVGSSAAPSYGKTAFGAVSLNSTGTLPILLSDFVAVLKDGATALSWTTRMEANGDHFSVERSTDAGSHWSTIGVVAAHGNSSTPLNYNFSDAKAPAGTSQYRLQLVDKDGKFAYSDIKVVRNGMISSVSVFPNPARDYVNVTVNGSAIVRLLSQSGQTLQEKSVTSAGSTTISLPVSSYPQGNYLIVAIGPDGSTQVSKLLISK
ncbi:MAG: T9SS type A sorting domain-containing protein, partial [Bacteroidetes bacterium]|nr:T9SS type A sorting domain-containing protein [Bacteroidota bacterium]